jgi:hypothetical protein
MKLADLIELFVERESNTRRASEPSLDGERADTSSLADIARILRELDGQYEADREPAPQERPSFGRQPLRS